VLSIPYIREISEKFKRIGERFNIKTVFKTKCISGNFLRRTKPIIGTLDKSQCVYRTPCECGREHIGETGRPLNIRIREHKYYLREGHIDSSKLTSHAFEGHRIDWINTTILQLEPNTIYRKHKEAAQMVCTDNLISQPSLDMCPIWFPLIDK
jgi:hypothetical protein